MSQCGALYASSWRYGFISEDSQWEGGSLKGDGGGVRREGYNWRRKVAGRRKGECNVTERREGLQRGGREGWNWRRVKYIVCTNEIDRTDVHS